MITRGNSAGDGACDDHGSDPEVARVAVMELKVRIPRHVGGSDRTVYMNPEAARAAVMALRVWIARQGKPAQFLNQP